MQIVNVAAASALVLSGLATAATTLTANTPGSLFVCNPGLLSWTGGVAPYYPRINTAGSTTSTIETLPTTSDTSYTWTVNLAEGSTFTFAVADSTGAQAYSAVSPEIGAGSTTSCLNSTSSTTTSTSASATSSGAVVASSSTSAGTTSASTAATSASSSSTKATSSTSTSASAATTTAATGGAATIRGFSAVVAGAVGVVVAALI